MGNGTKGLELELGGRLDQLVPLGLSQLSWIVWLDLCKQNLKNLWNDEKKKKVKKWKMIFHEFKLHVF